MKTFKISLSNFHTCNAVLLTRVTMLYITSQELTCFITKVRTLLPFSHYLTTPHLWLFQKERKRRKGKTKRKERTFMVLRFIFKTFIHFEFITVYGVSWWSSFIFLHVSVQISQHYLLNRLFLPHCMLMPSLSNINLP